MDTIWIFLIAAGIFLTLGVVLYKVMNSYVEESYGKKWLTLWGNKLYFWQSLLFCCIAGTAVIMYALKWAQVLSI